MLRRYGLSIVIFRFCPMIVMWGDYSSVGVSVRQRSICFRELEEYVTWCEHLEAYRGIELREVTGIGSPGYPVGELVHPEFGKITLHFLHYKAFAEAKAGWNRRYARLNPDNLFGIIHVIKHQDDLPILLRRFSQLPFRGKLLVTYPGILDENCFWEDSFFIHPNLSTYIHERIT